MGAAIYLGRVCLFTIHRQTVSCQAFKFSMCSFWMMTDTEMKGDVGEEERGCGKEERDDGAGERRGGGNKKSTGKMTGEKEGNG